VLKKLRDDCRALLKGRPGRRFIDHYRRHRDRESRREARWKTAGFITVGLILMLLAALLSLVPGVPGIALAIPAVALLVARLRFVAVLLDRGELAARRIWVGLRKPSNR
jgi:hypothetical protein